MYVRPQAPYTDYDSFESRDNFTQRAPRGKWIVEVLSTSFNADWELGANRADVWRGVEGETTVTPVLESVSGPCGNYLLLLSESSTRYMAQRAPEGSCVSGRIYGSRP